MDAWGFENYCLKEAALFHFPKLGARTFQVSATRFWNSLPNEIKCSSSFEILKKSLFKYFLESYKDVYHFTIA